MKKNDKPIETKCAFLYLFSIIFVSGWSAWKEVNKGESAPWFSSIDASGENSKVGLTN